MVTTDIGYMIVKESYIKRGKEREALLILN